MKSKLIGQRSKIEANTKLKIHLENDRLIMYGSTSESSGCVLRGALSLQLRKRTYFKSLTMKFCGAITVHWSQSGNHSYEFELVLPGSLPESTHVAKYYLVQYQLKAIAERSSFLSPNYVARKDIHLSRQKSTLTSDYLDPMTLANHWENKLDYDISLPAKVYSHGNTIPITIQAVPLAPNLKIRYVSCLFKEYMICKAVNGWFNGKNKSHGRIISYTRHDVQQQQQQQQNQVLSATRPAFSFSMEIRVPDSLRDIQCDAHNESVRVKHKLKFIMSIENEDGHISELRAVLPVIIVINTSKCTLPAYEDIWQTLPYDPNLMMALLGNSTNNDGTTESQQRIIETFLLQQQRQQKHQQQCQHPGVATQADDYGFSTLPSYSSIMMIDH
ncbi:hypothetical protein BDF20DRAFT_817575 [Mycotypha africana]|uniref:uncharacterized protein n=1 Tax=Mycotypha africana TaxID=64632 RepID=UPI002300B42B|nr:uncharacterized protein BDF20DRAFT_817575 [Mycotypha africana]KAI8982098.1 hypothetical protein BDF20DRAFT_817575 [Mycotypha africana]